MSKWSVAFDLWIRRIVWIAKCTMCTRIWLGSAVNQKKLKCEKRHLWELYTVKKKEKASLGFINCLAGMQVRIINMLHGVTFEHAAQSWGCTVPYSMSG